MKTETVSEALRAAPTASVGGLTLWGYPCPVWLTLLTIVYTIFLIIDKLPAVIERLKQFATWVKGFRNEQGNRE